MNNHAAMKKKLSLIALLTVICFNIPAQDTGKNVVKLTLEDAIQIAILQSPDAMMAKHRFRNSYWQYRYFKAEYLPQLTLSGNPFQFQNQQKLIETIDGSYYSKYKQLYSDLSLGLQQEIGFTGGTISVFTDIGYTKNFVDDTMFFSASPINISLVQPIFGYNSYKWERKIEPLKYQEAKQNYIETMEDVSITATRYFFSCLLAQINKEMQESNLANNDTLHQIAQGRYNMGTIAENEVLNMELNYLNSLSQLETAKLELENQMFYLKSYLRIKDEYDIELIPPTNVPNLVIDASEAVAEANANRADIISYQRQIMEAEQNLDAAKKNRFSANIAMTFGLDKSSHSIGDVYHDPQNKEVIMLGINVPILDWGKAKGQIKMAESSLELTRTTIEQAEIDFNQGLDIRLMTEEKIEMLDKIKIKRIHFAWDRYEDKDKVVPKLRLFAEKTTKRLSSHDAIVYTIVNFSTTIEQDLDRIYTLRDMGYWPYVMVYDKDHCNRTYKDLQRWVNNRFIFAKCKSFEEYLR